MRLKRRITTGDSKEAFEIIYLGVDPGKSGGYAVIQDRQASVFPWDDTEFAEFCRLLEGNSEGVTACVEKVSAMPGQGVTSMFTFGKTAGFIEGVLTACGIGYQLVPPQTWKKEFQLHKSKQDSITVCKRLFPGVNLKRTERCRTDSDGMAEALLMAEYARRRL